MSHETEILIFAQARKYMEEIAEAEQNIRDAYDKIKVDPRDPELYDDEFSLDLMEALNTNLPVLTASRNALELTIRAMQEENASLRPLKEAVDGIKDTRKMMQCRMDINGWRIALYPYDNQDIIGYGDTLPAAFADYQKKNAKDKPELTELEEAKELLKESLAAIKEEIKLFGHGQTIRDMRKKLQNYFGDSDE